MKLLIFATILGAGCLFVRNVESLPQTKSISAQSRVAVTQSRPVVSATRSIASASQGQAANNQYSSFQSVRKVWRCTNGECEEKTVNCKNGNCDQLQNRFKADDYQPEIPKFDPIPFPSNFNFEQIFRSNGFPNIEFPPLPQFDNFGQVDLVLNKELGKYYYANGKYTKTKCTKGVCEIRTRICKDGKCQEYVKTVKQ